MKLLSSITLALIGLSYGQVDYSDYSSDYSYELDQLDGFLADLEANPTAESPMAGIGARSRSSGPGIRLPPAIQAFTLPPSAAGARKLPPGIDLADFIGPNGFQTQRFLKALQVALRRQAEEQRRRQQAAREAAAAEAARQAAAEKAAAERAAAEQAAAEQAAAEKAAAEKAAAEKAAAEAAAKKAAEEEAARKAAAIEAAQLAAAEAARKAAEEAAALEAARLAAEEAERQRAAAKAAAEAAAARAAAEQAAAAKAAAERAAAQIAAEAERQRLAEEQAMAEAMQAESMMFGGFDSNAFGNLDGMVASTSGRPSGGRPSSGRPSSGTASAGTRDFIGVNSGLGTPETFNSCRVCTKMTAAECAAQPLVTCYEDKSKEGVFGFNEPNMEQDDRVCMLQTEQRKLTNGQIKTLFTSRCVTPMACESQLRQNFHSTDDSGLMKYNRCKQTGMLRRNGNINKSECAFCNKMSHENPATHQNNQWFPTNGAGVNQDCSANEDNCVVFNYKIGGVYVPMTMSTLFPTAVQEDPDDFPPHLYAKSEEYKELGQLVFDAAYIVD